MKKYVKASRIGKTKEVFVVQEYTGYGRNGWEDVCEYPDNSSESWKEAKQDVKDYKDNGYSARIIRRRVPNQDYVAPEVDSQISSCNKIMSSSSGLRKMTQKQIKDYVRDGVAIDITNYGFDEMDQFLREHNLDKIAVSRGTYGMNGGLLQDRDTGEMYAITARNSALMMAF